MFGLLLLLSLSPRLVVVAACFLRWQGVVDCRVWVVVVVAVAPSVSFGLSELWVVVVIVTACCRSPSDEASICWVRVTKRQGVDCFVARWKKDDDHTIFDCRCHSSTASPPSSTRTIVGPPMVEFVFSFVRTKLLLLVASNQSDEAFSCCVRTTKNQEVDCCVWTDEK